MLRLYTPVNYKFIFCFSNAGFVTNHPFTELNDIRISILSTAIYFGTIRQATPQQKDFY
jgi:hypothetical protein